MTDRADHDRTRRDVNPIVGAKPFGEGDASRFYGRTKELSELVEKVSSMRITALVAETAAGKSSLVLAGLLPVLRKWRLADRVAVACRKGSGVPSAAVPILVRDWAEAGAARDAAYVVPAIRQMLNSLDAAEAVAMSWREDPDLTVCRDLIRAPGLRGISTQELRSGIVKAADAELETVERARKSLRRVLNRWRRVSRQNSECYVAAVQTLHAELGSALVVLDQFEEILFSEKRLGGDDSVLVGVHHAYHVMGNVPGFGQLLSLRNDYSHLLAQLENAGLLSRPRFVHLDPLRVSAMCEVVGKMVAGSDVTVCDGFLEALLQAFSDPTPANLLNDRPLGPVSLSAGEPTTPASDRAVRLLPSSALLRALCSYSDSNIDRESFDVLEYVDAEENTLGHLDLHRAPEAVQAAVLRRVFVESLQPPESGRRAGWLTTLDVPVFARMAALLCSEKHTKQPVSERRLLYAARGWALTEYVNARGSAASSRVSIASGHTFTTSGRARTRQLEIERQTEVEEERIERLNRWAVWAIDSRAKRVLDRLRRENVLKVTPGDDEGITWELVHDGFAAPVSAWARAYERSPEFYIRWIIAPEATEIRFRPGTSWQQSLPRAGSGRVSGGSEARLFEGIVWKGCLIKDVDFTKVRLRNCDFSISTLKNCVFSGAHLENCDFSVCTLVDCTFSDSVLDNCIFKDGRFTSGCKFSDVVFRGGSLIRIPFVGAVDLPLPMIRVSFLGVEIDTCRIDHGLLEDVRFASKNRDPRQGIGSGLDVHNESEEFAKRKYTDIGRKALDMRDCIVRGNRGLEFVGSNLGAGRFENLSLEAQGPGLSFRNVRFRGGLIMDVHRELESDHQGTGSGPCIQATHCDFSGMVMQSCQLSRAVFAGVDMQHAVLRACDLREAFFGPGEAGIYLDAEKTISGEDPYVCGEHLELDGCLCSGTVFHHCVLDRSTVARCFGGSLTFKDCSLVCAGFYGEADHNQLASSPPWLRELDVGDVFTIDAKDSCLYHWDWGFRTDRQGTCDSAVPAFKAGDSDDRAGLERESWWDKYGREQVRGSIGWDRVGLEHIRAVCLPSKSDSD